MTTSRSAAERPAIDPIIKELADNLAQQFTLDDGVENARIQMRALTPPTPEGLPALRIEDHLINFDNLSDIPVRMYRPPAEEQTELPIVVFFHGGGFATGDLDSYDTLARLHAIATEAIVISVGYRLAPEHPYPAAVDDAWAALRWVGKYAKELGGDPARVAVAGDSAGGNLAAVTAQLARDHGGPTVIFQLLWYPATTMDFTMPSVSQNADGPVITIDMMTRFMRWYHPEILDGDHASTLPPTVAPVNATDLSGLPPAYIAIAEHDPIRDDGARYAELLSAAGVPTELDTAPTLVHGYLNFAAAVPAASAAFDRGIAALRAGIGRA